MKLTIPFEIENMGSGQTAKIKLLQGNLIHNVKAQITIGGTKCTDVQFAKVVESVQFKINDSIEWDLTGADFLSINKRYKNNTADNGIVGAYFARNEFQEHADTDHLSIALHGSTNGTLEFKFASTLDGNAYAPVMTATGYCTPDPERKFGLGRYIRFKTTDIVGLVGDNEITNLNSLKSAGVLVKAIHFINPDITQVDVTVDRVMTYTADYTLNKSINKDNYRTVGGVVEQTGWFSVDHAGVDLEQSANYQGAGTLTHKVKLSSGASSTKIGIIYEELVVG